MSDVENGVGGGGKHGRGGNRVVVVDFDMRFSTMVVFMIKAALAAIPAGIILAMIAFIASSVLTAWFS